MSWRISVAALQQQVPVMPYDLGRLCYSLVVGMEVLEAAVNVPESTPVLSQPLETQVLKGDLNRKDALATAWWIDTQVAAARQSFEYLLHFLPVSVSAT